MTNNASFWGCDIGGMENTYLARLSAAEQGFSLTTEQFRGSVLEIAAHIWDESRNTSPIFLVIDAALSYSIASAQGWRPCDKWLQQAIDPTLRNALEQYAPERQYASRVVSPSGLMGHRGLELTELFGAYFTVAETHPTANLVLMGANATDVLLYNKDKSHLRRLGQWVGEKFGIANYECPGCDGELDATACAAVAAAMGGCSSPDLKLITPVLGDIASRKAAGLPDPKNETPRSCLIGSAPYYLLVSKIGNFRGTEVENEEREVADPSASGQDTCRDPKCLLHGRPIGIKECPFDGWVKPNQGTWSGFDAHFHACAGRPAELTYQQFKSQICHQHWPR